MSLSSSPKLIKAALLAIDPVNPLTSIVIFQYNPETLSRSLEPQMAGSDGERAEALRLRAPPVETLDVEVVIDAIDQLERDEAPVGEVGIYPQLSSLEMMVYPKTTQVIANTVLLATGTIEVIPPIAPLTLFIFGAKRVLPVKVTQIQITEEFHDSKLNPIRARATLNLRVLNYDDLSLTHPGYALFLAHQVVKEGLSVLGSVQNIDAALGERATIKV